MRQVELQYAGQKPRLLRRLADLIRRDARKGKKRGSNSLSCARKTRALIARSCAFSRFICCFILSVCPEMCVHPNTLENNIPV